MGRKKKEELELVPIDKVDVLVEGYKEKLDTDPKYSLEVDPLGIYGMTEEQKNFIKYYVQFKNIPTAASLAEIDPKIAKQYFVDYSSQQEIRRINLAMYQRQFATKMLSIDEIGGYLTSLILDENVALGDTLKTKDKINVAKMIVDLNKLKQEALSKPEVIDYIEVEDQVSELSVDDIKNLLDSNKQNEIKTKKDKMLKELQMNTKFSSEELSYLKNLKVEDLKELLNMKQGE